MLNERPISLEIGEVLDYRMMLLKDEVGTDPTKDFPCVRLPWDEAVLTSRTSTYPPEVPSGTLEWHIVGGDDTLFIDTKVGHTRFQTLLHLNSDGLVTHYQLLNKIALPTAPTENVEHAHLTALEPALMAIAFLHTKHGAALEPARPQSRQVRRQMKRKGLPEYTYKVLKVPSVSKVVRKYTEGIRRGVRLHIVRGHWADHRKHGICNNPNARGIYWKPPHVRGDKELGIVDKDYTL